MADKAAAIREALRVLCEAGREDLIQPGVLSQAWVGLESTKGAAAGGVAAAISACSPPQKLNKNVSAHCLGDNSRKGKKEEATQEASGIPAQASPVCEGRRGRAARAPQRLLGVGLSARGRPRGIPVMKGKEVNDLPRRHRPLIAMR
ncbi:hypothetical protein NDU88_005484 [Pleurodeles waltl]|uniref:Uncharacterized protein n=1 Tax=Pleurodeles waltl TaxID=8319 RepID=A0AAV7MER2_PLEWA|nr:hypothetical protein NDU88_005484 [Pleurodeles waltl]